MKIKSITTFDRDFMTSKSLNSLLYVDGPGRVKGEPQKVKLPEQGASTVQACKPVCLGLKRPAPSPLVTHRATRCVPGTNGTQRGKEYIIRTHSSWQKACVQPREQVVCQSEHVQCDGDF